MIAFLFTDIEGSTQRWEIYRAAMGAAVRQHDELIRRAVTERHGYIFKTVGDAFCATFARAGDAAAAAVEAQELLSNADFSAVDGLAVRMAVHVGEAEERDGDYFGPTVNRVARLLGTGFGGQILLSEIAATLVRDELPPEISIISLGEHRLADISAPEHIFQLAGAHLRAHFPDLRTVEPPRTHLPVPVTPLVGRDPIVDAVEHLLTEARLVSLAGAGGIGKTRLALAVARRAEESNQTAFVVELASLSDSTLVPSAVIAALKLRGPLDGSTVSVIAEGMNQMGATLLVLDNCEHVVEAAASLCQAILILCPALRILTTTREALHVAPERVYRVPPLDLPPSGRQLTPSTALEFGATALFVDRAKAVDASFSLTDETAPVVAEIARRLDGIPLAIELAAANTRTLSPPELLTRVVRRLQTLGNTVRSDVPRQRTMHALIDWSFDLLAPMERILFRRLAVFEGAFTLASAEAVCSGEGLPVEEVLDQLASLVDKSLVVAQTASLESRYHLLKPIRDYALEKLEASCETDSVSSLHTTHMVDLADRSYRLRGTTTLSRWLTSVSPSLDDFRAALDRSEAQSNRVAIAQITSGLAAFWYTTGRVGEGRRWMTECLAWEPGQLDSPTEARLFLGAARLLDGEPAFGYAERARVAYEALQDDDGLARSSHILAWHLRAFGRNVEALAAAERGLDLWRRLGKSSSADYAFLLDIRATVLVAQGALADARAEYGQVLNLYEKLGEHEGLAVSRFNLAELEFAEGHAEEALRLAGLAATELRRLGSRSREALAIANCAGYYIALGTFEDALRSTAEALHLERQFRAGIAMYAIEHLAAICAHRGDYANAALLAGHVDGSYESSGLRRGPTEQASRDLCSVVLRSATTLGNAEALRVRGRDLSSEEALERAIEIATALLETAGGQSRSFGAIRDA